MGEWSSRLEASAGRAELAEATRGLFAQQASAWPLLATGLLGLREARTRTLPIGPFRLAVRQIPHRLKSTTARVDAASIGARPCFLCPANLPGEQRGVAAFDEWVALCNPFPILERHLTIVHREHVPQRLAGRVAALLDLARALPRSFVIYNGPACGASAPDHLHFQACDRALLPIEADTRERPGPLVLDHPARPIVLRERRKEALVGMVEQTVEALAGIRPAEPEPLVNLSATWSERGFVVYVFARRKHRPLAFTRGELLLSPAAVDLSGVLVTPREGDFERLTADEARGVLDEVMVEPAVLLALAERMEWRP